MPLLRPILAWFVILGLAVANGLLRETVLIPSLGRIRGFIVSGLMLCSIVTFVAYLLIRLTPEITVSRGVLIGVLWLFLTLVFELGIGKYAQHKSWAELLGAYRQLKDGNLWPLVLIVTLLAPPCAAWTRTRHAKRGRLAV